MKSDLNEKYKGILGLIKNKLIRNNTTKTTKIKSKKNTTRNPSLKGSKPRRKTEIKKKILTLSDSSSTTNPYSGTKKKRKSVKKKCPQGWTSFVSRIPEKLEFTKSVQVPGLQDTG